MDERQFDSPKAAHVRPVAQLPKETLNPSIASTLSLAFNIAAKLAISNSSKRLAS
jgi:hypothetical protein